MENNNRADHGGRSHRAGRSYQFQPRLRRNPSARWTLLSIPAAAPPQPPSAPSPPPHRGRRASHDLSSFLRWSPITIGISTLLVAAMDEALFQIWKPKMGKDDHKEDEDGGPLPAKTKLTTGTTEGWSGLDAQQCWPGWASTVDARRSSAEATLAGGG
ncbi:hypothetical protein NL676_020138 [Syzygium grande]|nr:hypothetical protein NL676_020138 [Syzygium grande]